MNRIEDITPDQQAIWDQQQVDLKENLKAQIDAMLVTDVAFDDFDAEQRAQTVTFKGFWHEHK